MLAVVRGVVRLVALSCLVLAASAQSPCPPSDVELSPCQCSTRDNEIQIWCSHGDLESVLGALAKAGEHITRPVDELIIESNSMSSLPGRAFAFLRPIRLMLRDNKLQRISSNSFGGIEQSLLEVFVVEPELKSFPDDVLESLTNLEAFTLQAGRVTRLPTFSNLNKLRYVHTQLPLLRELVPTKFRALDSLEQLHIVESPLLSKLESGLLQGLPRLTVINLTDCGISWVHPRSLFMLPSLRELTLSRNRLDDAGEVGRSLRELPALSVLRLDQNRITLVRDGSFVDIPSLIELYLDRNRISEIYRGAFHRLPSLRVLNLAHNNIRRLHPEFFLTSYEDSGVAELNLMNNRLDHVMNLRIVMDAFPRLKFLDLSGNYLQEIMFGSIRGHQTLERLHLNNNQLKRVVREAFVGMPALRELRLSNNSLSNFLEMPLWDLPALKGLDLSWNEFRLLDRRIVSKLPSLRKLDISHNHLTVVDPASFLASSAIEMANLSHNALSKIDRHTFNHLGNLFELDISGNQLNEIVPGLPRSLEHLHMSNNRLAELPSGPSPHLLLPSLKTLDVSGNRLRNLNGEGFISVPLLQRLNISENSLQEIEDQSFMGLRRLESLDLSNNRIRSVSDRSFRDLHRLRELNLKGNRIELIDNSLLAENKALGVLDLSHNLIGQLPPTFLRNNRELKDVMLSDNLLSDFPQAVMPLPSLETLDLRANRIVNVGQTLADMKSLSRIDLSRNKLTTLLEGTFSSMDNLTSLRLDGNLIQYVSPHVIRGMPSLAEIHLAKNRLSVVPSAAFSDLPSLLRIELQENELTDLATDTFVGVPGLLMLNLSHNQLTGIDRAGLHGLKSLELLDLSNNKLTRFDPPSFPPLDSLVQLRMDNNKLCSIQGSPFSKMSHLRMLSLKNNKLTSLSEQAFEPIRSTMYQLEVEGNPLRCSCDILWLQSWIKEGSHSGARCADGSLLRDFRLTRENCKEQKYNEIIPGCELNDVTPTSWKVPKDEKKPPNEESEYFYEEYVEYEENISAPISTGVVSSSTVGTPVVLTKVSTIPPAVMSHFIPGDTPTLYAGSKLPASSEPPKLQGPQFTFFGMPLPSLNLGKFWGSGRNSDGTFSSGRSPKGNVQSVPTPVLETGFHPLLPSSGFKPIFDPYKNETKKILPLDSFNSSSFWNLTSNSLPHATVTKVVEPERIELSSVNRTQRRPQIEAVFDKKFPVESVEVYKPSVEEIIFSRPNASLPVVNYKKPEIGQSFNSELSWSDLELDLDKNNQWPHDLKASQTERPYRTTASPSSSSYPPLLAPLQTTAVPPAFDSSVSPADISLKETKKDEKEQVAVNRGPASLSGFLAPGGQLPPYRPAGRPTITKVASGGATPSIGSHSSPSPPQAEGIRGGGGSGASSKLSPTLAWYFENYNNSNLEPYIGPGSELMGIVPLSSSSSSINKMFNINLFAFMAICKILFLL